VKEKKQNTTHQFKLDYSNGIFASEKQKKRAKFIEAANSLYRDGQTPLSITKNRFSKDVFNYTIKGINDVINQKLIDKAEKYQSNDLSDRYKAFKEKQLQYKKDNPGRGELWSLPQLLTSSETKALNKVFYQCWIDIKSDDSEKGKKLFTFNLKDPKALANLTTPIDLYGYKTSYLDKMGLKDIERLDAKPSNQEDTFVSVGKNKANNPNSQQEREVKIYADDIHDARQQLYTEQILKKKQEKYEKIADKASQYFANKLNQQLADQRLADEIKALDKRLRFSRS
jgi:hypothetical protein